MTDLAAHYSRFRVRQRILLTGHSHQAWPDVAFAGQQQAWLDAAEHVDDKWSRAAERAERVKRGFATLLGDAAANIALGQNTHELVTRWLSALPLVERPRIVTSDGEFHSMRRQLDRLEEEGIALIRVAARPVEGLAERLAHAIDNHTACVMVSSVLFETAEIVPGLDVVARACRRAGVPLLVDAYHHLNVVSFDLRSLDVEDAFVTGGGYKYCQLGEGNAFLRVPAGTRMRPVLTGWFAEFIPRGEVEGRPEAGTVPYPDGADAFAGATYDPTSNYRAASVFDFFEQQALTAGRLQAINRAQVSLLERHIAALDLDPRQIQLVAIAPERRGGFLALRTGVAYEIVQALRARDVYVDSRGDLLRLGPAPYVSDEQLRDAARALGEVVRGRSSG